MDVIVDENDLRRLLTESGLPIDTALTTAQAWQILDAESERFLLLSLVGGHGYPLDEAKPKIAAIVARKSAVLDALRDA